MMETQKPTASADDDTEVEREELRAAERVQVKKNEQRYNFCTANEWKTLFFSRAFPSLGTRKGIRPDTSTE